MATGDREKRTLLLVAALYTRAYAAKRRCERRSRIRAGVVGATALRCAAAAAIALMTLLLSGPLLLLVVSVMVFWSKGGVAGEGAASKRATQAKAKHLFYARVQNSFERSRAGGAMWWGRGGNEFLF
jgi:hypothetical protein